MLDCKGGGQEKWSSGLQEALLTDHNGVVPKIPLGWYFLVVKYGNTTGFELHFVVLPARKHGVNSTRGGR